MERKFKYVDEIKLKNVNETSVKKRYKISETIKMKNCKIKETMGIILMFVSCLNIITIHHIAYKRTYIYSLS